MKEDHTGWNKYNRRLALQLKEQGMQRAADKRRENLRMAQEYAKLYARRNGSVHADIVSAWLDKRGMEQLGNAAGSLFKGKEWEFTGEWVKSKKVTNHGHQNRVWRLK